MNSLSVCCLTIEKVTFVQVFIITYYWNVPNVRDGELLKMNLVVIEVDKHIRDDYEAVKSGDYTTSRSDPHNFYQVAVVVLLEGYIVSIPKISHLKLNSGACFFTTQSICCKFIVI